jgi:hypothetical protein
LKQYRNIESAGKIIVLTSAKVYDSVKVVK